VADNDNWIRDIREALCDESDTDVDEFVFELNNVMGGSYPEYIPDRADFSVEYPSDDELVEKVRQSEMSCVDALDEWFERRGAEMEPWKMACAKVEAHRQATIENGGFAPEHPMWALHRLRQFIFAVRTVNMELTSQSLPNNWHRRFTKI
jgi:hypothetical protein